MDTTETYNLATETAAPRTAPPRRRKRWLLPSLLLVALIGGMTAWMVHITARRPFVGKTDPASGYRCVFTIGQGWQPDNPDTWPKEKALDAFSFQPPKPAPFQEWLEQHLLHHTASATTPNPPPAVAVLSFVGTPPPGMDMELQDSYPILTFPKDALSIPIITQEQKRTLISGHRATWSVYKIDLSSLNQGTPSISPQIYHAYAFLIKVTDRPLWYAVVGTSDEAHHTVVLNEMRQIRDSFRIEQANPH
ncbi:MAG TPA: hypothetical protein VKU00_23490 [Chthonomonadaceae bacterium]|nr:hypothetical protein [Chthonomonadaceae bacterium]